MEKKRTLLKSKINPFKGLVFAPSGHIPAMPSWEVLNEFSLCDLELNLIVGNKSEGIKW